MLRIHDVMLDALRITVLGSARETLSCLQVGEALGYVEAIPENVLARLHRVIGTLVHVTA